MSVESNHSIDELFLASQFRGSQKQISNQNDTLIKFTDCEIQMSFLASKLAGSQTEIKAPNHIL